MLLNIQLYKEAVLETILMLQQLLHHHYQTVNNHRWMENLQTRISIVQLEHITHKKSPPPPPKTVPVVGHEKNNPTEVLPSKVGHCVTRIFETKFQWKGKFVQTYFKSKKH